MKGKPIPTVEKKKQDFTIYKSSKIEETLKNKPYIIPASKTGSYSKLDKAQKREDKRIEKEMKDYMKENY